MTTTESRKKDAEPLDPPEALAYTIQDLGQLKALADPLRVRILEALVERPRTTKQVADRLGEKPTKLYHHVEALDKVGLIELHSTRPNRGTLEKYFRAVARSFRADPELFSSDPVASGWASMGAELLHRGAEEIRALDGVDLAGRQPMLVQLKATTTQVRIERLQEQIQSLLDGLANEAEKDEGETVEYQMILAFYPVDLKD